MEAKKKLLFNDFVVQYMLCNFNCEYCINKLRPDKSSIWKKTDYYNSSTYEHRDLKNFIYSGTLKKNIDDAIDKSREIIDTPILRISGGEILMMKNVKDLLKSLSSKYEIVQIVTNGYFLDKGMIDFLKLIGNIHIHFSLDGHTLELNYYRVKDREIQERLLHNLHNCVQAGLPVEISSVLTKRNTGNFEKFLEYLIQYENSGIKVFPAPVRGKPFQCFYPSLTDINKFSAIMEKFEKYGRILPPKAFMESVMGILLGGAKHEQCWIPYVAIQSLDNGALTACPNGWTSLISNLHFDTCDDIYKTICTGAIYNILTQERPRIEYCKHCFTAYEIINLFFNDRITEKELQKIQLYSSQKVISRLVEIKRARR